MVMLEHGGRYDLIHQSDSSQPMQQSDITMDLYLGQLVFVIVVFIFGNQSERQVVVVVIAEISLLASVQSHGSQQIDGDRMGLIVHQNSRWVGVGSEMLFVHQTVQIEYGDGFRLTISRSSSSDISQPCQMLGAYSESMGKFHPFSSPNFPVPFGQNRHCVWFRSQYSLGEIRVMSLLIG